MVINAGLGKLICNLLRSPNEHFPKTVSLSKIDNVTILLVDKRFLPISVFFGKHWNNPLDTGKYSNKHSWRFFKFRDIKRRALLEKPQFIYLFIFFLHKKTQISKNKKHSFFSKHENLSLKQEAIKKPFITLVALRRTL